MYLIITENGEVTKTTEISESELQIAEGGLGYVIDISDPSNPLDFYDGNWRKVFSFQK